MKYLTVTLFTKVTNWKSSEKANILSIVVNEPH